MTGATLKITHQNPDSLEEMQEAFGIKDSDGGAYKEVFFGKESNSGRLYIAIKGNRFTQIAKLDDVARRTLLAFLSAEHR